MKRVLFLAVFAARIFPAAPVFAESPPEMAPEAGFLWAGSWESEKNLSTRADFTLNLPVPDLSLRLQLTGRRPAGSAGAFAESFSADDPFPLTSLSGGAYHEPTGSRFLYGMLKTAGLAARIRNPWIRGAPFEENHLASQSDLRTEVSSTALPAVYLYLGSPAFALGKDEGSGKKTVKAPRITLFGAFSLESEGESGSSLTFEGGSPAVTAGTEVSFSGKRSLRLESYYTGGTIPKRTPDTWFSVKPALPERDFAVYAGSLAVDFPVFGFAADGAWSETFAYGRGFYGNLGVRFGDRPWRFSLTADGAGSRYVSPGGGENHAGIRFAARLERKGKRSSLLRLDALTRGSETGDTADPSKGHENFWELARPGQYSLEASYRFPLDKPDPCLSRVSLKLSADNRDPKKETAAADALAGVRFRQFSLDTRLKLSLVKNAVSAEDYRFGSFRTHESLVWTGGFLQCRASLGLTGTAGKDTVWDGSLSAVVRGKRGWGRIKLDSPELFRKWVLVLSWHARW